MKILLDENIDQTFPDFIPEHDVHHVTPLGWSGIYNGELLKLAAGSGFEIFITADKNMSYQQSMAGRPFPLFVLDVHPNTIATQVSCLPQLRNLLDTAEAGNVYVIAGPHGRRR